MKVLLKIILPVFIFINFPDVSAQVTYYKGEWTTINRQENFSGLLLLDIKDSLVTGEIIWTFVSIDSADVELMKYYKGLKGKMGIENVQGMYLAKTFDIQFQGISKTDPDKIIGMDKYLLKLSRDKLCIYGRTLSNGENNGLVFFYKINTAAAEKEFKNLKAKILLELGDKACR